MLEVVYACNRNYLEQTLVSMVSLVNHTNDLRISLIADDIPEDDIAFLNHNLSRYDLNVNVITLEKVLEGVVLNSRDRHPETIYTKLFLDRFFSCDRILYLDSDVVVTGDLSDLTGISMEGYLAAGVMMPYSLQIKAKIGLDSGEPYLCDGIVLINLKQWRKEGIGDRCADYIAGHDGNPYMLSEGVLNWACKGKVRVLPPEYNLMPSMIYYNEMQISRVFKADRYYKESDLAAAREKPVIIHFMNELYNRPWFEPCDHPYKDQYRTYRERLYGEKTYEHRELGLWTKVNRLLFKLFPFRIYLLLYHLRQRLK